MVYCVLGLIRIGCEIWVAHELDKPPNKKSKTENAKIEVFFEAIIIVVISKRIA